jgi:hypothetical protein
MSELIRIPRPDKPEVGKNIVARLLARLAVGPQEPALNGFIAEINAVVARLDTHVDGAWTVVGTHAARVAESDARDDDVDTWIRKIEGFLDAEALRRTGPNAERARALLHAAFPDGRAHIDDRIIEENRHCRSAISALRAPESAETLAAIDMPAGWLDKFEEAVTKSEEAFEAIALGRSDKSAHVDLGRDAELDWEDVMLRLRHYIAGRAKRDDVEKKNEGRKLLEPLTSAVKKLRIDAETRATLRLKKAGGPAPATTTGTTGSTSTTSTTGTTGTTGTIGQQPK